jgi:hypothetical protein
MIDGQGSFSIVTTALNDLAIRAEFAGSFEGNLPIVTLMIVKVLSGSGDPGKAGSAENGEEGMYRLLDCHRSFHVGQRRHGRG